MKYIIIILAAMTVGCASAPKEIETQDLLFREDLTNLAYKSVTIKDYIAEDEC